VARFKELAYATNSTQASAELAAGLMRVLAQRNEKLCSNLAETFLELSLQKRAFLRAAEKESLAELATVRLGWCLDMPRITHQIAPSIISELKGHAETELFSEGMLPTVSSTLVSLTELLLEARTEGNDETGLDIDRILSKVFSASDIHLDGKSKLAQLASAWRLKRYHLGSKSNKLLSQSVAEAHQKPQERQRDEVRDWQGTPDILGEWHAKTAMKQFRASLDVARAEDGGYRCTLKVSDAYGSASESCWIYTRGGHMLVFSWVTNSSDPKQVWIPDDFELAVEGDRLAGEHISHSTEPVVFSRSVASSK
jgi:hypothetical protein